MRRPPGPIRSKNTINSTQAAPRNFLPRVSSAAPRSSRCALSLARNTGGSIGVSLASNVLAHREQFHQSRLAERVIPSSVQYQDARQRATQFFVAHGSSLAEARKQAFAWIGQQVQAQAAYLAYVDVFWVLMVLALLAVPLALTLRKVRLGAGAPMAH